MNFDDSDYWQWQIGQDFGEQLAQQLFADYVPDQQSEQQPEPGTSNEQAPQVQAPQVETAQPEPQLEETSSSVEKGNYH